MSKNKNFSDTAASRYSLALYELAEEGSVLSDVEEHSFSIIDLIENNDDFKSLIKDPTNNKDDQLKIMLKISDKYQLNKLLIKLSS